jgi:hypothetical protein
VDDGVYSQQGPSFSLAAFYLIGVHYAEPDRAYTLFNSRHDVCFIDDSARQRNPFPATSCL